VREVLLALGGYESKEVDGQVMAAFHGPRQAVEWALALQCALLQVRLCTCIWVRPLDTCCSPAGCMSLSTVLLEVRDVPEIVCGAALAGYESKEVDGQVMAAFHRPRQAVEWALALQCALLQVRMHAWVSALCMV
jgi:hypothetical protein